MIQLLSFFLGLYLFYNIFSNKGSYKSLLWVIISMLLINSMVVITNFPIRLSINRWLILSLLFTHIYNWQRFKWNWNRFPLKVVMLLTIIGSIIIGVVDPRLTLFSKFNNPFRDITETYFLLFIGYASIAHAKDLFKMAKPLFYTFLIIGLYGIFNFITKLNPYYEFVLNSFFKGGDVDLETKHKALDQSQQRFRSVSTFSKSFDYGYISGIGTIFFLYISSYIKNKKIAYIGVLMGLIGVVLCFSRTVLLAAFLSMAIYVLLAFKLTKMMKIVSVFIGVIIVGYFTIPTVQMSVDNVVDIFISGGDSAGGSSVSMRTGQTAGAIRYFLQEPIRGNGYEYINKELGWADRDNAILDSDMFGFESVIYVWLIEQGLIGLVTKLILLISIIIYLIRARDYGNKKITGLGMALIFLFLMFSIGTGALGAWPVTMLLLGGTLKVIQLRKKHRINSQIKVSSAIGVNN